MSILKTTLAATLAAFPLFAAAQDRAGYVEGVQPDGFQSQGGAGVELSEGDRIFRQATVYTRQYGTVEIQLDDGTDLTVAPSSSITIDDFVFAGGGDGVALSLLKGAARIASGRLSKSAYAIDTPTATIGIRGTEFWLDASPDKLRLWVTEGAVVATPKQSGREFVFEAPAYAECGAASCESGDAPPLPVAFPTNPGGTGDPGVDSESSSSSSSSGDF